MTEEATTVKQDMKALGIEPAHFDTLYGLLKKEQKLPPGDAVPWKQYINIVNYLRDKLVLGEDNKVQSDGLKVFDSRIELEVMLDKALDKASRRPMGSSGGIAPCREYDDDTHSGGIAPCR